MVILREVQHTAAEYPDGLHEKGEVSTRQQDE